MSGHVSYFSFPCIYYRITLATRVKQNPAVDDVSLADVPPGYPYKKLFGRHAISSPKKAPRPGERKAEGRASSHVGSFLAEALLL